MRKVILDIEANSLRRPTKIWLIVCKDIDTDELFIFRNILDDDKALNSFIDFSRTVDTVIGHNLCDYDLPVISLLTPETGCIQGWLANIRAWDTLIMSRMVEYSRPGGHSLEAYGELFGLPKLENKATSFFSQWSQELEDYCVRDVEINHRVWNHYARVLNDPRWLPSLELEHNFQGVVNSLHSNGFAFDTARAEVLLQRVTSELSTLDREIADAFPPRLRPSREVHPRVTRYGTLNRGDFRFVKDGNLAEYNGGPFTRCSWVPFNPSSHKQIIEILHQAGWSPTEKTSTHIDTERELNRLKYSRDVRDELLQEELSGKLEKLKISGWKVNEKNLDTLPKTAPSSARTLAKRILLESRRRTLTEWLTLVSDTGRIHGKFIGIGAWTHRMAHQEPNTANIPNSHKEDGSVKLLGKELRSLWRAPKNRLLVGVDADSIQLRIFAHYVNDKELTRSIVDGRKDNKTDPHSLNQRVLGSICKSRQAAKRFLYALLLGGGVGKLAEILGCTKEQGTQAIDLFLERYPGFDQLRKERFPSDAKRGYFIGLDGREVRIPGDTLGDRRHLCMSGYLQNGEAIIMKRACLKWHAKLHEQKALLVNFVHDEWQTEVPNDLELALLVARYQADSLREVGEDLKLNCPLAGSYYNDDKKDYTIGTTWYQTH